MHGGNRKKLGNMNDSSQDGNDDYEEQIDETARYPKNKNNQNQSKHRDYRRKLDNMGGSSQDENDDYEVQIDEITRYLKNKNSQNLPMYAGNQRKLDNMNDSSQDENDDYEEQIDETTRYPKDKNNQNLSMHGGNQKKLDNNSDSSQDENDEYKESDFLSSGHANKKKERELYYEEQIDETTRYSKNKNNQNLFIQSDNRRKLDDNNVCDSQNSQNLTRDNRDNYSGNSQGKNRKPNNSSSIWPNLTTMPGMINRWMPGSSKDEDEIKVIFHVHFPEGIDKVGNPVVLGNVKELGSWKSPIVKLSPQNRTYWRSSPVIISLSSVRGEIQYKYAIHTPKPVFRGKEKIEFEGVNYGDNRILNIKRNDQFDIFKSNHQLPRLSYIHDFAFVDYIYNSINADNLKAKVMEYQHCSCA
ncbi:hypothetical protein RirG_060090 [Rhizophagus irregularis DAOM 197198w]|uniref:CBM20 domain-containing protein n=1 Tax=Rhizophagus irregularis (strain DAOM 197198w) TaxID=1432141 RepID=A0A015JV65_RHIIW|nr:hypothetical protein RirG_060090 [Rhizophagus irregularis DAOM 197198w]